MMAPTVQSANGKFGAPKKSTTRVHNIMPRQTNIQIRRGSASDWTSVNPTLAGGELAMENDTMKLKVGDGSTPWNSLQYVRFDGGDLDSGTVFRATLTGSDVQVTAFTQTGSSVGVGLTFSNVTGSGTTTVTQGAGGNPSLPENFSLSNSLGSYTITTTATFTGSVFVKFVLPSTVTQQVFESVRIFKLTSGVTTDVTVLAGQYAPDFATRTVYASVDSFSNFYVIPSVVATTTTTVAPQTSFILSETGDPLTTETGDNLIF